MFVMTLQEFHRVPADVSRLYSPGTLYYFHDDKMAAPLIENMVGKDVGSFQNVLDLMKRVRLDGGFWEVDRDGTQHRIILPEEHLGQFRANMLAALEHADVRASLLAIVNMDETPPLIKGLPIGKDMRIRTGA